ncbi:DUF308 domain-containing protein [Candidatus Dependentiae bacterium]|nr:DUF308 domain-containing protein [Candidatus Dependentiae bacterium]
MQYAVQSIHRNWFIYFILGLLFTFIGFLGLIFVGTSTLASVIYLGAILVSIGALEAIRSFKLGFSGNAFVHLIMSLLYGAVGIFMILKPEVNALTLTLVLGIGLTVVGVARTFFAATHSLPNRNWLLFQGLVTIALGLIIWLQWPVSGTWALGTIISTDIILNGFVWMKVALQARYAR